MTTETHDSAAPPRPAHPQLSDRRVAVGLLIFAAMVYALLAGGHTYSSDEEGLFATTKALVENRSPAITVDDGNRNVLPVTVGRHGEAVTVGGLAQSVVAAPLYLLGSIAGTGIGDPTYGDYPERLFVGWTNSLVTAAGVALVFLTARRLDTSMRHSVLLALVYGFGTFAFPHAKTFFSEPLATTLSVAALYLLVRSAQDRSLGAAAGAGAAIGFALHARASVALFVPILGLYLLWSWHRPRPVVAATGRAAIAFAAGLAGPALLLLWSNWWRFGDPLDVGYSNIPLDHPIAEGLYGLFLSPGKAVFLYAPVVALGLATPFFVSARHRATAITCVALGLANAVFFARFPHWHGDHSFGPRYLTLSLPFWIIPIGPLLARQTWRRALAATALAGVIVASLGTVMYFNQYFHIAERESVEQLEILDDGPNYWREMHFDPWWSPVLGHARALPDVVTNTFDRLDGDDPELTLYPATTAGRYGWYFAPPQADSWIYWLFATHGPKRFLVIVPVLVLGAAWGAATVRPALARP